MSTKGFGASLSQAIACYQAALRVFTPATLPHESRQTNRNLAALHFAQGDWESALTVFYAAADAGERLYRSGLSIKSKATEATENTILYHHAAFAAARLGRRPEDALLILEQGKTRLLAEALHLRVPRPPDVPDAVWITFEQATSAVRAIQAETSVDLRMELDPVQGYANREQRARAASEALDAAIAHVQHYAAGFLTALDLATIYSLLPDPRTAVVTFCLTDQGSISLVVSHRQEKAVQLVDVPGFTQPDLAQLLVERNATGDPVGGWLVDYLHYRHEQTPATCAVWRTTITRTLAEIAERLLVPILAALPDDIDQLILLPSGGLFLLPLHAAPLPSDSAQLLCDHYQVRYAPSAAVLVDCRTKAARANDQDLFAVINPEDDPNLLFTIAEGANLAGLFDQRQVVARQAGTKAAVTTGARERAYLHFACHGSYDWLDPLSSGLALADGRLTLTELQEGAVDLSAARLVTLSACETGLTDVIKGSAEEYVGLPAGFMLAGVPCVVSSLWSVPDLSTALLMERFYRNHLSRGMDFAAALREVQAWVRGLGIRDVAAYAEQCYQQSQQQHKAKLLEYVRYYRHLAEQDPTSTPFAHPYYWAAFTVNGM